MRRFVTAVAVVGLVGCVASPGGDDQPQLGQTTNFIQRQGGVPDDYIVVLRDDAAPHAAAAIDRLAAEHGAAIHRRYGAALHGFAAHMTEAQARALAAEPEVAFVEQNGIAHASAVQSNATDGLDRVDQRTLPLDGLYHHVGDGAGVTVFVIDTGIRHDHVEFTGRILAGATAIDDGNETEDCNGHGTHVSGTVAGTTFGMAKLAKIVPIRVLDCEGSGSFDGIIAGVDFVAANHPANSVANMSLGGPASAAVDTAIKNAVTSGVTIVVAAGNETQDACNVSPAREPTAITVGATTLSDARADFSNFGRCVDILAPGVDITSAGFQSATGTAVLSGTSMASPHVAGAAALFAGSHPGSTPAQVAQGLLASATRGQLTDLAGSPNLLLFTDFTAPPQPGGPTVTILSPADGATVTPPFSVSVGATGDNLVAADLAIDGTNVQHLTMGQIAFQVTDLAAGQHRLEVAVQDANNQSGSAAITVTVGGPGGFPGGGNNNPPPPPFENDDDSGGCSASHTSSGGGAFAMACALAVLLGRRRRRC